MPILSTLPHAPSRLLLILFTPFWIVSSASTFFFKYGAPNSTPWHSPVPRRVEELPYTPCVEHLCSRTTLFCLNLVILGKCRELLYLLNWKCMFGETLSLWKFRYSFVIRVLRSESCKRLFYFITGHASKLEVSSDLLYKMFPYLQILSVCL